MFQLFLALLFLPLFTNSNVKPNGCKGISLCHAYKTQEETGLNFYGGVLVAKAHVSGTLYSHRADGLPYETDHAAQVLRPRFKLSPGFQVGLGYIGLHECWSVDIHASYWRSSLKKDTGDCDTYLLHVPDCIWCHDIFDTTNHLNASDTLNDPVIDFVIKHGDIDLSLCHACYGSEYGSFIIGFGLKNSLIKFCSNTHFCEVYGYYNCCAARDIEGMSWDSHDIKHHEKTNFHGIGPKLTFVTKGYVSREVALFNEFDAALLAASTKTCNHLYIDKILKISINDSLKTMSPYLKLNTGIEYSTCAFNDTMRGSLKLSVYSSFYFNQFNRLCYQGICKLKENQNNCYSLHGGLLAMDILF